MFQFAGLPPAPYVFRYGYRRITSGEFPHSEIPGSQNGQLLPRAYRSRPRPSSALGAKASTVCPCSLDQKNTGIDVAMEFSRSARAQDPHWLETPSPSKLNSVRLLVFPPRSTFVPGEPVVPTAKAIKGSGACRSKSSGIPRKEVIQPQLPLRLPCYDFVPVISPTLGRCLLW